MKKLALSILAFGIGVELNEEVVRMVDACREAAGVAFTDPRIRLD